MASLSHLKALQALELAIRTGSLKDAAKELAITPAAVGQRIKTLEHYLGFELLRRGRAGIRSCHELTAAMPHLHQGFAALEAAARELDLQRGHEIHVAAASDLVELWLEPRLAHFREAHPNVRFCINGQGDVPMRLGRVDCEITFGPIADDSGSDLLFRDFVLPIASPANLERVSRLTDDKQLEGFPLLHVDLYKDDPAGLSWPEWIARNGVLRSAPERGMRFQRITAALDAVAANAGVSLSGLVLILDRLADGSIKLLYPPETGTWSGYGFCARFRTGTDAKRHIAHFRAWLRKEAETTAAALADVASGAG